MKRVICILLLAVLVLSGCAQRVPERSEYSPEEAQRLVIYTSHQKELYTPIIREFEQRTGIWVEVVTGGSYELLEKIAAEADAPKADLMFGGGADSLELFSDCFAPYLTGEYPQLQSALRDPDNRWTPFSALPVVLVYNPKLVGPNQIRRWADLADPMFNGRIAFADPTKSSSSFTALMTNVFIFGEDVIRPFATYSQAYQLSSSGQVPTTVADGICLAGVTLEEAAMQQIRAGSNLAIVYPEDGTSCVPDGCALVKNAPHRSNAERFLDFAVSREVQELLGSRFSRRSVRTDVALPENMIPLEDITLIQYDFRWAAQNRQRLLTEWELVPTEDNA